MYDVPAVGGGGGAARRRSCATIPPLLEQARANLVGNGRVSCGSRRHRQPAGPGRRCSRGSRRGRRTRAMAPSWSRPCEAAIEATRSFIRCVARGAGAVEDRRPRASARRTTPGTCRTSTWCRSPGRTRCGFSSASSTAPTLRCAWRSTATVICRRSTRSPAPRSTTGAPTRRSRKLSGVPRGARRSCRSATTWTRPCAPASAATRPPEERNFFCTPPSTTSR